QRDHQPGRLADRRRHRAIGSALHDQRSEEHTSELQSLAYLVCRLLLEKKKPSSLVESELFAQANGAFTGAHNDRIRPRAPANRGTIFLDEPGDPPLESQPTPLRISQQP